MDSVVEDLDVLEEAVTRFGSRFVLLVMNELFLQGGEAPDHWAGFVVVDRHWKLLTSTDGTHAELSDLQQDPLEKADQSDTQPEVVAKLLQKPND